MYTTFPFFEWTTPVGRADNDCSASPKETCSRSESYDCIHPKRRHSLVCRTNLFCSLPGTSDRHLWTKLKKNSITKKINKNRTLAQGIFIISLSRVTSQTSIERIQRRSKLRTITCGL